MEWDPINSEIVATRRRLAAECGNDVRRIGEETRRREAESGRTFVHLQPKPPEDWWLAQQAQQARQPGEVREDS